MSSNLGEVNLFIKEKSPRTFKESNKKGICYLFKKFYKILAFILFFLYKFVSQMGVNRFSKNGYNQTSKIEV
jgi:flagellar biogenesis protein FliO